MTAPKMFGYFISMKFTLIFREVHRRYIGFVEKLLGANTPEETLTENFEDLSAFDERDAEPNLSFEDVVEDLKHSGKS